MGPAVDKYRDLIQWLDETVKVMVPCYKTLDEWYELYFKNDNVSIKGFGKLIQRAHAENRYYSKIVMNKNRKKSYLFQVKDINLCETVLRHRKLKNMVILEQTRNVTSKSAHASLLLQPPSSNRDKSNETCGLALLSHVAADMNKTPTTTTTTTVNTTTTTNTTMQSPFSESTMKYIELSKSLDFTAEIRPNVLKPYFPSIKLHNAKSLSEGLRWHLMCLYMEHTKGDPQKLTWKEKNILMSAIIRQESYHNGYSKTIISNRTFCKYIAKYNDNKYTDRMANTFRSKKGENRVSYIAFLELNFPKYLHKLYRYAVKVMGLDATVPQLIQCMSSRSRVLHPFCPTRSNLKLNIYQFWSFFYSNGGQLKRPTTKPSLKPKQKIARVEWAKNMKKALSEMDDCFYCFLDEKWFYTTSRRKKMKILPRADWESEEDAKVVVRKVHSRRYTAKVMYMAAVGLPVKKKVNGKDEYVFDGKAFLKRVSNRIKQDKMSTNQFFTEEYLLNEDIKNGEWKDLIQDPHDTSVNEALDMIASHYNIDEDISPNLIFTYYTWTWVTKRPTKPSGTVNGTVNAKKKRKTKSKPSYCQVKKQKSEPNPTPQSTGSVQPSKASNSSNTSDVTERVIKEKKRVPVRITRNEKFMLDNREIVLHDFTKRPLTIDDLMLHVRIEKGTPVERDCSCDSDFMIKNIHELGKSVRHAYRNVAGKNKPIVLVMDNAGGHGRNDVKKDYEDVLNRDYKIIVHWQVPNSPETNLLDLGAWMALQSIVEKKHRLKIMHKDVLAKTIEANFSCLSEAVLERIYGRWLKVLDLIIKDKGNNDLVEKDRGLTNNPIDPSVTVEATGEEDVISTE